MKILTEKEIVSMCPHCRARLLIERQDVSETFDVVCVGCEKKFPIMYDDLPDDLQIKFINRPKAKEEIEASLAWLRSL